MCLAAIVQSTIGLTSAVRLRKAAREDNTRQRTVQSLVDPRRILAASMVLLQVLMAILATGQLADFLDSPDRAGTTWLAMAIVALVYLILGVALPRAIASKQLDSFLAG